MHTKPKLNRRDFAKLLTLAAVAGASSIPSYINFRKRRYPIAGQIVGANYKTGHLLRSGLSTIPERTETIDTVIVGGGISGLSAGWHLKKNNKTDFIILEMDTTTGGNSQSGENTISKYPWGAHYVPLPNLYDTNLIKLFEELGVITGYEKGLPVINDYYLCSDPQERLFFQGRWQEGLIPTHGIRPNEKKQYDDFFHFVESLKGKKGKDGKYLFAIPLDYSSQDEDFLALDKITMHDFLLSKGWDAAPLHWYVNYCCRDDFGVSYKDVSAWAGIHYFSSRNGHCANSDSQSTITWPEGNGWLARKLRDISSNHIRCQQLAYNIEVSPNQKVFIDSFNPTTKEYVRFIANHVIYSGPRYTADKVIKGLPEKLSQELTYSPWMVANISLKNKPLGQGEPFSWDNVSYYSDSLGYINANHQNLKFNQKETVITYYLPLDKLTSKESRHLSFLRTFDDWLDVIIPDLEKMHPDITKDILHVDVWLWGHGMISPGVNYLWNSKRKKMQEPLGPIQFAHTDMSGISIFEEGLYHGCKAAENILKKTSKG
ncbi:NAD(P)/FAD-dependent oxidoreductase [Bacteriovorax stolpii]|uniref:FAD-dependent oxidoreductase n=1 Tax=Bacteriovorax stolpii TaxID=960 RepID=A0A2K9NN22_BACTC|nr:FAD/NAD(P)-binding protein [Bacteriovorax stolpii]AUN96898.1 FAD-dependent oxidoreductase [Bacteriovorax stolpii]QDK43172.1 NAD(P)/FAD-dependent oxidoreductase [Bacteriovorax stolpii]TDP53176.1 protoporphyrinogen oxidase [Bacteriovorax stolpii]